MSTTFDDLYERFFYILENDKDFFVYYNITTTEALALAKQRASTLIPEAISRLVLSCVPDIDFTDYNTSTNTFNETFTSIEISLIVQLMFEKYLEKDVVKLKAFKIRFTPSDLNSFSPAQERTSFMNMYEYVKYQSDVMIDKYSSKDRLTGERKILDYSGFSQ